MRVHRGFLGWGVFLVLAGAIPLAARAGSITTGQLGNAGSLWPLILVGVGVGLLLSRTRYGFLGGLIVAATFGTMVGAALAGGVTGLDAIGCGPGVGTTPFSPRNGQFTGSSASVDINLNCGDLTLAVAPGAGWRVEGYDRDGAGPNENADNQSLSVRSRVNRSLFDGHAGRDSWRINIPDRPLLDTQLTLNAGSSTLSFAGANLASVETTLNAGAATIDLSGVHQVADVRIQLNAGSIGLTLPSLWIRTDDSFVSSYDFDGSGLTKDGSTWETPGFDSASVKIDLHAQANAGSVSLNRTTSACSG